MPERKVLDKTGESGIIRLRSIASRNLPNGLRTAPSHIHTETEIESMKKDIASIEADESVFKFNKGHRTGYDDVLDEIRVKGLTYKDGAECIAELEILRHRKTPVSKELSDFYEKYMGRKYL